MSPSLPKRPSLEHLKKSAKQLLAAQRHGDAHCCPFLRRLRRFGDASNADILAARVTLKETQLLVALHYGFASWEALRHHLSADRTTNAHSLEDVIGRCPHEIPEYAGPGVPLAVVAALNHAGVPIDFMDFAAATGWAFSFGYKYDDVSPAYMAVRGDPKSDGPLEVFAFLPDKLGFGYELAPTQEHEVLWRFVKKHVDAGRPVMSEHLDGGLITGYQQHDGKRHLYFDGTVGSGWIDIAGLQPYAVYVLVKQRDPMPPEEIARLALRRAAAKGSTHDWHATPQGMAALQAYLADVGDATKDFSGTEDWFCWAAFERLMARRCSQQWLQSVAEQLTGRARDLALTAAKHYGQAFEYYDQFRLEVSGDEPTALSLRQRARTPDRIATITPLLREGISAEAVGLDALSQAADAPG